MSQKALPGQARRRLRYSLTMTALMVLILVAVGLPLPQRAVALAPILLATVESVKALRELGRAGAPGRERLWPLVTLGLMGMLLLSAATQVAFYGPQKAYEDCMSGANTQVAQADCRLERERSVFGGFFAGAAP